MKTKLATAISSAARTAGWILAAFLLLGSNEWIRAAAISLCLVAGCQQQRDVPIGAVLRSEGNTVTLDDAGACRLNDVPVSDTAFRQCLAEHANRMAKDQLVPAVALRAPESLQWSRTCRVLEECRFAGFYRLTLLSPRGPSVDLSNVRWEEPSPARDLGARILVLTAKESEVDLATLHASEEVIISCARDCRHGDVTRLLAELHMRGVTNILITGRNKTKFAAPAAQRCGE